MKQSDSLLNRIYLWALGATFIDFLTLQMSFEIVPFVLLVLGGNAIDLALTMFAAGVCSLLGAASLGKLNDLGGFIPALFVSNMGSTVGLLALYLCNSIPTFMLAVILMNTFNATEVIMYPLIAKSSKDPKQKQARIASINTLRFFSRFISPMLGGILATYVSLDMPALVSFVTSALFSACCFVALAPQAFCVSKMPHAGSSSVDSKETKEQSKDTLVSDVAWTMTGKEMGMLIYFGASWAGMMCGNVATVLIVATYWGFLPLQAGLLTSGQALLLTGASILYNKLLAKGRLSLATSLYLCPGSFVVAFTLRSLIGPEPYAFTGIALYMISFVFGAFGMNGALVASNVILMQDVPPQKQGFVAASLTNVREAVQLVVPPFVYAIFTAYVVAPYIVAALCAVIPVLLGLLWNFRREQSLAFFDGVMRLKLDVMLTLRICAISAGVFVILDGVFSDPASGGIIAVGVCLLVLGLVFAKLKRFILLQLKNSGRSCCASDTGSRSHGWPDSLMDIFVRFQTVSIALSSLCLSTGLMNIFGVAQDLRPLLLLLCSILVLLTVMVTCFQRAKPRLVPKCNAFAGTSFIALFVLVLEPTIFGSTLAHRAATDMAASLGTAPGANMFRAEEWWFASELYANCRAVDYVRQTVVTSHQYKHDDTEMPRNPSGAWSRVTANGLQISGRYYYSEYAPELGKDHAGKGPGLMLDVHGDASAASVILVFFHTGCMTFYNRSEANGCVIRNLISKQYAVISVDYRLTGWGWNATHLTKDVHDAVLYIERRWPHAKLVLWGEGDGGQLALLGAYMDYGARHIVGVVADSGQTNMRQINSCREHSFCESSVRDLDDTCWEEFSPLYHVTRRSVPTLVFSGGFDTFSSPEQPGLLIDALKRNEVPHAAVRVPNGPHIIARMPPKSVAVQIYLNAFDHFLTYVSPKNA